MEIIDYINLSLGILFFVCYAYQLFYIFVPMFKKQPEHKKTVMHKYAVLISARNEALVIENLIKSIKNQTYPKEYVDVFVVADNCTDNTAEVCRNSGAIVFERFNKEYVGKGYALDYLIPKVEQYSMDCPYDGYFVFDADNVLENNYIEEMNKTFSDGYRIVTSYRNSKNYGDNWISAGYALWFLRESKYLNYSRMLLDTSCAISGTGFLFKRDVLNKSNGWKFFLLTEDIQFTMFNVIKGEKIGFCKDAVFYDEQPTSFRQAWRQRLRWAKGFLQVFKEYGSNLISGMFKKMGFACFDMAMTIMPIIIIMFIGIVANVLAQIIAICMGIHSLILLRALIEMFCNSYICCFFIGIVTTITEWNQIHCSNFKKILYVFTLPIFMMTYIPIGAEAFFKRVKWDPIVHTHTVTAAQITGADNNLVEDMVRGEETEELEIHK